MRESAFINFCVLRMEVLLHACTALPSELHPHGAAGRVSGRFAIIANKLPRVKHFFGGFDKDMQISCVT